MDSGALDEWFAKADDILTDWHYSPDAMVVDDFVGIGEQGIELVLVPNTIPWETAIERLQVAVAQAGLYLSTMRAGSPVLDAVLQRMEIGQSGAVVLDESTAFAPAPTPRERALRARRDRNVGPPARVGIDGKFRRHLAQ